MITSTADAAAWRDELDSAGKRLVFTNGCFDLLHVGHVRYLREARALGDALVIALNGDESVRALKGDGRPINNADDRAEILRALECVDRVVVFDEPRATSLIEAIRPHIYAKGGDYTVETLDSEERNALEGAQTEIRILSLVPGKSTSQTLSKMRDDDDRQLRLAVLGSGAGSNFEAIASAIDNQQLQAEIRLVISDNADAQILTRAKSRHIPALHINPGEKRTVLSAAAEKEIIDRLKAADVDLVILAGFMRIIKASILEAFPDRILNVHPSLLPAFPGLDAPGQAIAAGETETGCTVHVVNAEIDSGPILGQARVPIEATDDSASLHARIQDAEHLLFPPLIEEYGNS
ncbi:MAG: phosphoribosylglycinamide formyltransferase, partial [Verrucomicrobiota bacterium]